MVKTQLHGEEWHFLTEKAYPNCSTFPKSNNQEESFNLTN